MIVKGVVLRVLASVSSLTVILVKVGLKNTSASAPNTHSSAVRESVGLVCIIKGTELWLFPDLGQSFCRVRTLSSAQDCKCGCWDRPHFCRSDPKVQLSHYLLVGFHATCSV